LSVRHELGTDMHPMEETHMKDIWIGSHRCLRVFYRPWKFPWRPYAFHRWGFFGFGAGPIGFMYWPNAGETK